MPNTAEELKPNLSPEHFSQLRLNGIYRADPEDFRYDFPNISQYWATSGKYHCCNWCFEVSVWNDGRVWMKDNYWLTGGCDTKFELTDDNWDKMFPKFKLIMDDRENYRKISFDEKSKYAPEDIVECVFGSGGWSYSHKWWIRKDAKPVLKRQLAISRNRAKDAIRKSLSQYELASSLSELENLLNEAIDGDCEIDDASDMKRRDEMISDAAIAELTLEELGNGNIVRYVKDMYYNWYDLSAKCILIGKHEFERHELMNSYGDGESPDDVLVVEFAYIPEEESIVRVISTNGKIESIMLFDATVNNCKLAIEGIDGDLDEYEPWHDNAEIPKLLENMKKIKEAIAQLSEEIDTA